MEQLFEYFNRKLKETTTDLIRYKYSEINWSGHALGLVGPRGVGKSTMLLQHIKMHLDVKDTLYVSADQLYFASTWPTAFIKWGVSTFLLMKFINMQAGRWRLSRYSTVILICSW